MILHLTEQNTTLRLKAGRLLLEVDGQTLSEVPARKVRMVVLHGNVRLSTPVQRFLMQQGAAVLFASLEGQLYGLAHSADIAPASRLRAQLAATPGPLGFQVAQAVLQGKLMSALRLVQRVASLYPQALESQQRLQELLVSLPQASTLDQLRGIEGLAARTYFEVLSWVLRPYGFDGRNRRPPKDPPNAALSYGYALLQGRVWLAVLQAGLHPEVGVLHAETRRNPALVLDLMEEFRIPVVDQVMLRAFVRKQLDPQLHFEKRDGGVYLNHAGRKVWIGLFEQRLTEVVEHPQKFSRPLWQLIELQASRMAAHFENREVYSPFYLAR